MKRPPVLRPRLSGGKEDLNQDKSIERVVKSTRNSSAEQKDRHSSIIWNFFGCKNRALSINKEKSLNESSSRESISFNKDAMRKKVLTQDIKPKVNICVGNVRNSFYLAFDHLHQELEKFEKIMTEYSK